jgi:hypothetical protein
VAAGGVAVLTLAASEEGRARAPRNSPAVDP